jgi:hypothetical protein
MSRLLELKIELIIFGVNLDQLMHVALGSWL